MRVTPPGACIHVVIALAIAAAPVTAATSIEECGPLVLRVRLDPSSKYYDLVMRHTQRWENALVAEQRAKDRGVKDPLTDPAVKRAYESFFAEYLPVIRAYLRRRLYDDERGISSELLAEAAQEFYVKLMRARHDYDPMRPFFAWSRFKALASLQKARKARNGSRQMVVDNSTGQALDIPDGQSDRAIQILTAQDSLELIQKYAEEDLTPKQAEAMRAWFDWKLNHPTKSLDTVARGIGLNVGSFNERVQSALRNIRSHFSRVPGFAEDLLDEMDESSQPASTARR